MGIESLKKQLLDDDTFLKYRSIRQTASAQLPYESLCDELERIQQSRAVRTAVHNLRPNQLLEVSLDEVNHRARLTEILVKAKRNRAMIQPVVDGVWNYIASTYVDELKTFKTSADRQSAISTVLNAGYTLISELDSLIEQCELVIKEIDQSSFSLSRVATLMELTIRNERLVNVDV